MRHRALALILVLGLATTGFPELPIADADVRRGIALVDDGEYDSAIIALDGAVRRLASTPGHAMNDLAEAYFYLGVAYLGKGQETSAKARFREAVRQARDMSPSPEKGGKGLLIVGAVVLAGGGAALAAGGGGGADGGTTPENTSAQTRTESGAVRDQEQAPFLFVASRAGTFEATITWQNRNVNLTVDCAQEAPPYTQCAGTFNRTTDTSARFTAPVTQQYVVYVSNYSGQAGAEPFTITLRYP